jgi:hypothetical protein
LSQGIHAHSQARQRSSEGIIDRRAFQSVIDLNDHDSTDFSTQMVNTYLAVANSTLSDMDKALCVISTCLLAQSSTHPFFLLPLSPLSLSYGVYRGNKDIPNLSLLATSLQDTSVAIGVEEVQQSCSRLRNVIDAWTEKEELDGAASIGEIVAALGQLKSDFAIAKSWLTRYVETGKVPDDWVHPMARS